MYYLFGDEEFLIEKKIKEIVNEKPNSKILKFNSEININEVINQISNFSLFEQERILIFYDLPYLIGKNKKNEEEAIVKAIALKPETTQIIFVSKKLNDKINNQLFQYLRQNAKCIEYKQFTDEQIIRVAHEKIKQLGASISEIDLLYFLSKIPNKLSIIISELERLAFLDKNISRENIDDLVQKHNFGNEFDFINSFQSANYESLIKNYHNKINNGETIPNLISQISNVLELCSRIYSLKKSKISFSEMEKILEKHPFVIKKNNEFLEIVGHEKIFHYLELIAKTDIDIKLHKVDEKIAFERFLLEIIK